MKKLSKVISIFMAAVIALSAFAVSASAVATELTAGNTKETATNIPSFGTEYVSTLSQAGEQDWFKFTTLSEDAYYTISFKNYNMPYFDYGEVGNPSIAPNIYLYDTYLKELSHSYNNSTRNIKLQPNTVYYIKVRNGDGKSTGNFSLTVNYRYDKEDNVKENATSLAVNSTNTHSLDGWYDVDWFKITTTSAGEYTIKFSNHDLPCYNNGEIGNPSIAPNIYIYDIYSKELTHGYNSCTRKLTFEANSTYYIMVRLGGGNNKDIGTYSITITNGLKSLSKITIDSLPTKTTYKVGESFDKTGLAVTAHYSDGSKTSVTSCTVNGFDSSTTGTKELTISYTENGVTKTATFDISITEDGTAPAPDTGFDFMAILSAIWNFFVAIFNFILSLFA